MGVRTCESRCLFSGSKGEVCCIEPLHAKVDLRDHPITQYSLLAMASLTKVMCCLQEAWCETSQRGSSLLYTQTFYFAFLPSLKILVIGLKPSLKVWMTFPYGRVSNKAKQVLFGYKHFLGGKEMKSGAGVCYLCLPQHCGIAVIIWGSDVWRLWQRGDEEGCFQLCLCEDADFLK